MKRRNFYLAILSLSVCVLAACGKEPAPAATPAPTATSAPEATATPAPTATPEPTKAPTPTELPFDKNTTLMDTYGTVFDYSGVCVSSAATLKQPYTVKLIKKYYNSITLENEMKPDHILGNYPKLITIDEAKALGYVIPDNYTDPMVPQLNFDATDLAIQLCAENDLGFRAHTLVWHSQTPNWFFRENYTYEDAFTSPETMDARMEFYIRTVMSHVYNSDYGHCVYAWDVVNEYWNADDSNWIAIYGAKNHNPSFVKLAFEIADDVLKDFGIRDKVTLIFNDFNTYMNTSHLLSIVEFINSDGIVCDGFGMQAHLDTSFPSTDSFKRTLKSFLDTGLEVQITELDVTCKNDLSQSNYYYSLMSGILDLRKEGGKITGITYWGMGDDRSWRGNQKPLLFSMPGIAKPAYYKVIQAYLDAGYEIKK